jgi:glucosamine--fructose-6-phosphate aminotransferase (isomerizing)
MSDLVAELREQPGALRAVAQFYAGSEGGSRGLPSAPAGLCVFTGMGASYHAALIAAAHAAALGLPALAVEAIDLLNYTGAGLLRPGHTLIYLSQSGKSVEVEAILRQNGGRARVIGITNQPESPLGRAAHACLPILADQRYRLASKNYINSLAVTWLLARSWAGAGGPGDLDVLLQTADRVEALLAGSEATTTALLDAFAQADPLVLLGHGPHAATARQSALMLSEWARTPALYGGVGAFRHGFVETVTPRMGVLFFAPPGRTEESALELANALPQFGVTARRVANGRLVGLDAPAGDGLDEFLSPILDVIPMQVFTAALSERKGVTPDFRYIDRTRVL